MRKNIMEFWIFQQYIVEVKFKHKILLEFADNQTTLTHSIQELLHPMKSENSKHNMSNEFYLQVSYILKR